MKKLLYLLIISGCSVPQKGTVTICDVKAEKEYVSVCMKDADSSSTRMLGYQETACWKEARSLFCHKVFALKIKGRWVPCDSVSGKYKKYCKLEK